MINFFPLNIFNCFYLYSINHYTCTRPGFTDKLTCNIFERINIIWPSAQGYGDKNNCK